MKKNEEKVDRWVRMILGAALLGVGLGPMAGFWAVVLTAVGIVALLTGFFGWCPAYGLFGASTCPRD